MSDYLYVKNWEELQHYKTRRPPWIKLYRRLLTDMDFLALSEREQWQLVRIWILSAEELPGGWVKNETSLIRALIKLEPKSHLAIPSLVAKGWLIPRSKAEYEAARASTTLAPVLAKSSALVQRTEKEQPSFLPSPPEDGTDGGIENGGTLIPIDTVLREMPA